MKKIVNKISFVLISAMTSVSALAADNTGSAIQDCAFVDKLHQVFRLLQAFAFIGAAFFIAGWAWDFIAGGKAEVKTIKEKGTGLLVGFLLLFMVGVILGFVSKTVSNNYDIDCGLANW